MTTITYDIDILLKKFGVLKTDSIDILLKKLGVTTTNSIDVLFSQLGLTSVNEIDILLEKAGLTKTDSIDGLLKKLNITKIDSVDVVLKKLEISVTSSIDVMLEALIPPTPVSDVPETLKITNGIYTLWARPINWKENQSCKPAIRPVPLSESEYLDSDTWILKPRTIECKFRLSDREKDVLESIYNHPSTLPSRLTNAINNYLDFYLLYNDFVNNTYIASYTWHYLVWIREKSYKFEYEYQNNRYVRWWTVSLICDVQSFAGSSFTLPTWDDDNQSDTFGYTTYTEDPNWNIYPYYDPIAKGVKIHDQRLDHVLDFTRDDQHPPMIPKWINQLAEVDSYLWNECVLDTSYTCRMTNAEKYHMDLLLQAHSKILYEDYIHNLFSKATIAGGEYIVNGGFEDGFNNWTRTNPDYTLLDTTHQRTGLKCVSMDGNVGGADMYQNITPVPVSAIKAIGVWARNWDSVHNYIEFKVQFTDDSYEFIQFELTSTEYVYCDFMPILEYYPTKSIKKVNIACYGDSGIYFDDVSLSVESEGAWIAEVEAQWDPVNWIKPWKVSIALKANNSEIESRTADLALDSTTHLGTFYLDEIATSITGMWIPFSTDANVGVHKIYYFQPAGSTWDCWTITGDAIKLISQGDSAHGIAGEHILTVLIYGDCTIYATLVAINPCIEFAGENIVNGTFDIDLSSWVVVGDAWQGGSGQCYLGYSGGGGSVEQTLVTPVPVSCIDSFSVTVNDSTCWAGDLTVTITYTDDTTTICDPPYTKFENFVIDLLPYCVGGKTIKKVKFAGTQAEGTFYIDDVTMIC